MDIMSPGLNIAGPQCPIVVNSGSTPTSLVWKGLTEFITMNYWSDSELLLDYHPRVFSKCLQKSLIALGVFSKCFCHCTCLRLCCCLFVGQVMYSHRSDQMSQRPKISRIALWRCSLNVFVIVFVFVFVFVERHFLTHNCAVPKWKILTTCSFLTAHSWLGIFYVQ